MIGLHITDGDHKLVIDSDPIASSDNFYVFSRGNKVVGRIKATFDFSELPIEYHQLGIQMVLGDTRRVCLALDPLTEEETRELENFRKSWWDKLLDFKLG